MRSIVRIRYHDVEQGIKRSEPILLDGQWVEVILGTIVTSLGPRAVAHIQYVESKKPVRYLLAKNRRAVRVAVRQALVQAGASLGMEVRKKI